jgi:hypothetical protein
MGKRKMYNTTLDVDLLREIKILAAQLDLRQCMSSKGFGQVGHKNKRGFQVPNTFFRFVKQPLMSNYTSCVEALYFS